jgi:hypothetical protein
MLAQKKADDLKRSVRACLRQHQRKESLVERRARMLLQSAGFLDVDKLIEHRPPLGRFAFWNRPPMPQLSLAAFNGAWVPEFAPLRCAACCDVVRGSMFESQATIQRRRAQLTAPETVHQANAEVLCEACFHAANPRRGAYVTRYKHCILHDSIAGAPSRAICHCSTVQRIDSAGRSRSLLLLCGDDKHRQHCGLLRLTDSLAQAKYEGMLLPMEKGVDLAEEQRLALERAKKARAQAA